MMETYGNRLVYWDQKLRTVSHEYDRVDPTTMRPSIVDMLIDDPEIRAAYEKFPAVKDGIKELATLIKLHEDIDTDRKPCYIGFVIKRNTDDCNHPRTQPRLPATTPR